MSAGEQLVVLLALTNGLLDTIPIEKIPDAEAALLDNGKEFPADVVQRILSGTALSNPDHDAILKIAGNVVAPFLDKPEPVKDK